MFCYSRCDAWHVRIDNAAINVQNPVYPYRGRELTTPAGRRVGMQGDTSQKTQNQPVALRFQYRPMIFIGRYSTPSHPSPQEKLSLGKPRNHPTQKSVHGKQCTFISPRSPQPSFCKAFRGLQTPLCIYLKNRET